MVYPTSKAIDGVRRSFIEIGRTIRGSEVCGSHAMSATPL